MIFLHKRLLTSKARPMLAKIFDAKLTPIHLSIPVHEEAVSSFSRKQAFNGMSNCVENATKCLVMFFLLK